jgi:UDP-GlcNAc:undecaprenyl-phosphate GlcNAc-1-phosphate transferase
MGDAGAYLIGFVIAALAIGNSEKGAVVAALIAPVLALALPITDVVFAMIRRGVKGLPMFRADRGHIHHRLIRSGLSSRQTVLILYAISLFALIGGLLAFAQQGRYLPIFIGFFFVVVLVTLRGQKVTALSIQTMFTESMQSRQDARNSLHLKQWFLMEVERADSGKNLWSDYRFILRKMGFCAAELELNGEQRSFFNPNSAHNQEGFVWVETHNFDGEVVGTLLLKAEKENFSERQFDLIADLAAESWVQAMARWKELHKVALDFNAKASEPKSYRAHKARNLYKPTY